MSMMVSFVLSFFPRDVLDEILNLIESVSEDFPSYSFIKMAEIQGDEQIHLICLMLRVGGSGISVGELQAHCGVCYGEEVQKVK